MAQAYTYCRTRWNHGLTSYPTEIWSELDGFRFEVRRLEVFSNGTILWGSAREGSAGGAEMYITPLPELDEMADDPDNVEASVITAEEFEALWARRPPARPT